MAVFLTENQRTAMRLRAEGRFYHEIGAALGVPRERARQWVAQGQLTVRRIEASAQGGSWACWVGEGGVMHADTAAGLHQGGGR